MRELKFRVWGLYEDQYAYIDEENQAEAESFWDKSCIAVLDEKHIVDCWADEDGEGEGCEYCDIKEVEAIEQYTGLKDKNGKEIYEGDIIQEKGLLSLTCVEWNKNNARYMTRVLEESKCVSTTFYFDVIDALGCEVIGNIHENPELLGGINDTNKEEE